MIRKFIASVLRQVREVIPAFLFFFILFHLLALTKAVAVDDYSHTALRAVFATVGALVVAKAILMVEKLAIPSIFASRLLLQVLWKTLLFGLLAIFFRLMEELIPRIWKHESFAGAIDALNREMHWPQFAILTIWLFVGLLVYTLAVELVRLVGSKRVAEIVLGRRDVMGNP